MLHDAHATDRRRDGISRRDFLRFTGGAAALIGAGLLPVPSFARRDAVRITVLHTNDVHSRIDPFPSNDPKYPGLGGFARRAALIRQIRSESEQVLLLDAGDIFQGTPYFNLYKGALELQLMSDMGYDAATIGNHDFDGGIDNLRERIERDARFPFLNANYDLRDTPLHNRVLPHTIIKKGGIRIGILGIGIELQGLVDARMYGNARYQDPLPVAEQTARRLKHDEKCDLVIALSHLGYRYSEKKVSDEVLARETSCIDLIIGGHTHTFLDEPVRMINRENKTVHVAQVGWAGIRLGRIDYFFDRDRKKSSLIGGQVKLSDYTIGV
jgi:5'-nucleotidase